LGKFSTTPEAVGPEEFCAESYARWQCLEERAEQEKERVWRRRLVELGDAESDKLQEALESGWER
jgi:hypothetical protein